MKIILPLLSLVFAASTFAAPMNATSPANVEHSPENVSVAGPKPSKSMFGGYRALNRSIKNRETSITRDIIFEYKAPRVEKFQGQYYWAVPFTYATVYSSPQHLYGKPLSDGVAITEARALVSHGRVAYWLYDAPRPVHSSIPVR
ncbi:MAG: hypothetical protein LDL31_13350 [Prosthecobacter sp.]|jgi:hypothetical protein|nr:hypothetical protein [Prosthecobacter sp.]